MTKKILILINFFVVLTGWSQNTIITENTKISILTVGVADEAHSLYGHTALRIQDPALNFDEVYNYGMFDFRTENFVLKFVKGDLQYYAAAYPYADFDYSYREDNRSIYEQVLNLSLTEKQQLFEKLNTSLYSADKYYTYKFIDRNCTTKIIDLLNSVLENKPIIKKNPGDKTYREVLFPYADNHFYEQLGINIIFGEKVDHKETTIFLPLDLMETLNKTNYKNKPLVMEANTLFDANRSTSFSFLDSIYSLMIVLLLFVIMNKKVTNIIYFSIFGLLGVVLLGVGFYSFHKELLWNYNALLFNPLFLILVYFMLKNNTTWIKRTSWTLLFLIGIYCVYMLNKIHLLIVLPIIIATSILILRVGLKKN